MGIRFIAIVRFSIWAFLWVHLAGRLRDVPLCVFTTSPAHPVTSLVFGVSHVADGVKLVDVATGNATTTAPELANGKRSKRSAAQLTLLYAVTTLDWSSTTNGNEATHTFCRSVDLAHQWCMKRGAAPTPDDVFYRVFGDRGACMPKAALLVWNAFAIFMAILFLTANMCCGFAGVREDTSLCSMDSHMSFAAAFWLIVGGTFSIVLYFTFPVGADALDGLQLANHPYEGAFISGVHLILCAILLLNTVMIGGAQWTLHMRTTEGYYSVSDPYVSPITYQRFAKKRDDDVERKEVKPAMGPTDKEGFSEVTL